MNDTRIAREWVEDNYPSSQIILRQKKNVDGGYGERFSFYVMPVPSFCGGLFLYDFYMSPTFILTPMVWHQALVEVDKEFRLHAGMRLTWWDKAEYSSGSTIYTSVGGNKLTEFVNPNSGNTVALFSFTVPNEEPFYDEEDEIYEEDDDDDDLPMFRQHYRNQFNEYPDVDERRNAQKFLSFTKE